MNCRQARRTLDDQLNHPRAPLAASEQAVLRDHLATCAGCARFARALDDGLPALKRLPTIPPDPRTLALLAELPTRRWEQPAILRLRWWAGRAVAFAGVALAVVLVSGLITTLAQLGTRTPAAADTPVPAMAAAPPSAAPPATPAVADCSAIPDPVRAAEDALFQAIFTAAATTLGLTPEQLKIESAAGHTVGGLAAQRNVTEAQVRDAGIAAGRVHLATAVQQGTMTQAEADKWSQTLPDLVAKLLVLPSGIAAPDKGNPEKATASAQPDTALDALSDAVIAAGASTLDLTPDQLIAELKNDVPIGTLAEARGLTLDAVRAAMLAAGRTHIDAGTASGALTADQAADLTKTLPLLVDKLTAIREPQTAAKPGAPCAGGKPGAAGTAANVSIPFDALQAGAATALGLSSEALQAELVAGKSIATLAQERNADPAQVKAAMSRAGADYLALAVQRGDLTQSQADELTRELPEFVAKVFQISEKDPGSKGNPGDKGN